MVNGTMSYNLDIRSNLIPLLFYTSLECRTRGVFATAFLSSYQSTPVCTPGDDENQHRSSSGDEPLAHGAGRGRTEGTARLERASDSIVRRPLRCATGHPSRTRALGLGALVVPAHPLWHAAAALLIERHAFPMRARRSIRNGSTASRLSLQAAFGHPPGPYAYRGLRARASLSLARSV